MITRCNFLPYRVRLWLFFKLHRFYPHISGDNVSLTFNPAVKLDLKSTDIGHRSIIFTGFREIRETRHITNLAKKGGLLIDVGANYGYFTCLWAAGKPGNRVIAFEASEVNLAPLQNNVEKNGLSTQVEIVPLAAGKEKGRLRFSTGGDENQTGWGGFVTNPQDMSPEVEVVTLDSFAEKNGIETIDALKIDTEGADTWVLYGAKKLLQQKKIKHIFFEHNLHRMGLLGIKPDEAIDFLQKLDYHVEQSRSDEFYARPK